MCYHCRNTKTKTKQIMSEWMIKLKRFTAKSVFILFIVSILAFYTQADAVLASELDAPDWLGSHTSEVEEDINFDEGEYEEYSGVAEDELPTPINESEELSGSPVNFPYDQTFKISAYYSPIPGQGRYFTGSYAGDIRLNGSGVNGADGTPVYPGMIAAPRTYPFGTKMKIPGVGTVSVHDRGGAIVNSGLRGNNYDRLDIWMGYGDKGLKRALDWGKRTLEVTVYGVDSSVKEEIFLNDYSEDEKYYTAALDTINYVNEPDFIEPLFSSQLSYGMENDDVKELNQILKNLNYLDGEVNSVFGENTIEAVQKFQIEKKVISDTDEFGAGFVGPRTMNLLAALKDATPAAHAEVAIIGSGTQAEVMFKNDLALGDEGQEVADLQAELKKINLLGIEPTGYFGEVTEHAIFKFQQIHKIVESKMSFGAGVFGPLTREKLNKIISVRKETELMIIAN